jgi:hypothetical protein
VINEAFETSDRQTVVQRSDVDSFFGSRFEADFVLLASQRYDSVDVLLDRELNRRLRPLVVKDGERVAHYLPTGPVPDTHTEVTFDRTPDPPVRLALKLEPSELMTAVDARWEIVLEKDVRLQALVALLKAAHLTLFHLLGYSYALSASGHFLGWDVLGRFADANLRSDKQTALTNAALHFPEFVNLVRPMLVTPDGMLGTVTDGQLLLCSGAPNAWAFLVLVRTGAHMNAVLVPILEDESGAARFMTFLRTPTSRFEVKRARFLGDRWEVAKIGQVIDWPEARFSDQRSTDR